MDLVVGRCSAARHARICQSTNQPTNQSLRAVSEGIAGALTVSGNFQNARPQQFLREFVARLRKRTEVFQAPGEAIELQPPRLGPGLNIP